MNFLRKYTIQQRFVMLVILMTIGLIVLSYISLSKAYDSLLEQKHNANQQVVESVYGVIEHFHQLQTQNLLDETKAKEQALAVINTLRYDKSNYFWVNDFTPTMLMHPIKPALIGKDVASVNDVDGIPIFINMVKVVRDKGQGFVPYKWPKPGVDEPVEKIAFVKGFSPWQWIVGSGTYIDDIDATFSSQRNTLLTEALITTIIIIFFSFIIGKSIIIPTMNK